jgi:hypothetical protein
MATTVETMRIARHDLELAAMVGIISRRQADALWGALLARDPQRGDAGRVAAEVFRREGEYWALSYAGTVFRLRDSKGLRLIVILLQHPGHDLHALELAQDGAPEPRAGVDDAPTRGLCAAFGDAVVLLDQRAKAAYRQRISELRDELAEAERCNDIGTAEHARAEIDMLGEQLAAAIGLGGRDRQTATPLERARGLVTVRIRATIKKISRCEPSLGHHLAASIKTGRLCSYSPDPMRRVVWTF